MSRLVLDLGDPRTALMEPVPAPRMTKAAAWSLEPGVLRYKAFCKEVRRRKIEIPIPFVVEFYIHSPVESRHEQPLVHKPDCDNLVKGLIDAVFHKTKGGDSHVWALAASKRWCEQESHFIIWPVLSWRME